MVLGVVSIVQVCSDRLWRVAGRAVGADDGRAAGGLAVRAQNSWEAVFSRGVRGQAFDCSGAVDVEAGERGLW
jgi:hypothetical protein